LERARGAPRSKVSPIVCTAVGLAVGVGSNLAAELLPLAFPGSLIPVWLAMIAVSAIAYVGWPRLWWVLLAYGLAARIPVVVVMFLAMRGRWGTHYDIYGAPAWLFEIPFATRFVWLALLPQLVFWVGYTVIVGMLGGVITAALIPRADYATVTSAQR